MTEKDGMARKRILLADDQEEVRETVKLLLSIDGHQVTEARNGMEALELFAKGQFDLVVTDYAMPGMLGDELAKSIKRLSPGQAVLMITGSAEQQAVAQDCIDGFLNKPFTLTELRQAVAPLLAAVPA